MGDSTTALDYVFKVLMIGDAGVGKSSILQQFTDGYFNESLQSTIGEGQALRERRGDSGLWRTEGGGVEEYRVLYEDPRPAPRD